MDSNSIFLIAIGLGSNTEAFEENGVDGDMIGTLTEEDLTVDLGMSGFQARKFQKSLVFTVDLAEGSGGGGCDEDTEQNIRDLEE